MSSTLAGQTDRKDPNLSALVFRPACPFSLSDRSALSVPFLLFCPFCLFLVLTLSAPFALFAISVRLACFARRDRFARFRMSAMTPPRFEPATTTINLEVFIAIICIFQRRVRAFADENQSCMTADEFAGCATSHGGLTGVTMIQAMPFTHFVRPDIKLEKIFTFQNFRFDADEIRAYQAYQIGVGKSIQYFGLISDQNQHLVQIVKIYHTGTEAKAPATGDANWFLLGELYKEPLQEDSTDDSETEGLHS